jgi:hypothetical protein
LKALSNGWEHGVQLSCGLRLEFLHDINLCLQGIEFGHYVLLGATDKRPTLVGFARPGEGPQLQRQDISMNLGRGTAPRNTKAIY